MQIEDAHKILRVLSAAYPSYPVGDDTVELYLAMLTQHVRDADVGLEAARQWVLTQTQFPKPSQLLEECQSLQRRRAREQPALPAEDETLGRRLSKQENAQRLAELREQIRAGTIAKRVS